MAPRPPSASCNVPADGPAHRRPRSLAGRRACALRSPRLLAGNGERAAHASCRAARRGCGGAAAARGVPLSFGRRRSRSALGAGRARVRPRENGLRIFRALGLSPARSFPAAFSQRGSLGPYPPAANPTVLGGAPV
ncbi:uncharacterized protein LOC121110634 [Gallus gallus]|uniref:uncharacterized protein LOC121110634 n=1 Tax=Gallus gallus TaxID=9031 RepID=UPI001AE5526B|nr:uncharacterized protein LOC121110634 [Gallus gallus]